MNLQGPHLSTVCMHRCVRNECMKTVSRKVWDLLVLRRRNVCKYKHNSEHAYAENLKISILEKESTAACVLCPLIANTQISYFKLNICTISVKSYKGQLGS